MRIPTLAALCGVVVMSWACNPENQPGVEEDQPAVEDRTPGEMERETTDREGAVGMKDCPMEVPGTTVSVNDADGTVAMTFVTTGDVEELRDSVRKMAERFERRAMRRDREGRNGDEGGMPKATTAVEQVDDGARIVFVPEEATDLDELRDRVRNHQERMSSTGKCAMKDDR